MKDKSNYGSSSAGHERLLGNPSNSLGSWLKDEADVGLSFLLITLASITADIFCLLLSTVLEGALVPHHVLDSSAPDAGSNFPPRFWMHLPQPQNISGCKWGISSMQQVPKRECYLSIEKPCYTAFLFEAKHLNSYFGRFFHLFFFQYYNNSACGWLWRACIAVSMLFHGVFKSEPVYCNVKFDVPSFTYLSHICRHRPLGSEMLMSELKQT